MEEPMQQETSTYQMQIEETKYQTQGIRSTPSTLYHYTPLNSNYRLLFFPP